MSTDTLSIGRLHGFDLADKLLLLVSITCSAAYFVAQRWQPYPGNFILKGLCVTPLALMAFHSLRAGDGLVLGTALLFSGVGDVLLDLDPQRLFVMGLVSFLVAHLFYVLLYVRNRPRPLRVSSRQWLLILSVLIYSAVLARWLWPDLGGLAWPVAAYVCVLTAMVVMAVLVRPGQPWVTLGALLFLLSDSLIAVNKFKLPVAYRDYLVWSTYYLGQCGIALGFLQDKLVAE